ncbi:MAG: 2-amino-4-hydroxy-6-hydroxymethyldihydropteridine diphosphokinase, partial [Ignavibacteria bacterium]|nr:2-amino-4-hydroxy-6-hydroxymethyldihydropteridine diphosphokinase [Ignavibacteria bacterium]
MSKQKLSYQEMNEVYLSLGSNVGDRFSQIVKALLKIDRLKETRILEISSFYQTEPYGYKNQNEFINLVVRIETNCEPEEFLSLIKSIEIEVGRKSRERWSEREIDIDILFFGSEIIQTDSLTIP